METEIKGVIFDYGGTIDSRGEHWCHVIWRGWQRAGLEEFEPLFRDCYVHAERFLARNPIISPSDDFHTLMRKKVAIELDCLKEKTNCYLPPEAERVIADYCNASALACVQEAKPILERIGEAYPMALVSNFYGNVSAVLSAYDIRHLFGHVIESAVVGVRKPDPRIFLLGAIALGFEPSEVLVVGDSLKKDILPAQDLGCRTAWIKGRGWDEDADEQEYPTMIGGLPDLLPILKL